MKKDKNLYIFFSILIMILCISIVPITFQNDTFSSIKIGTYIINNGIDFNEHFNFNSNLKYHNARWLFNVIVAFIFNNFSYLGVYIFTIIISIILGLLIYNILLKNKNNIYISFIITIFTIFISRHFITTRAQIFSYILFLLEVFYIEKLINTNKKRYILLIILISILVANIHTTVWPMTIILYLPYFAEYFLSKNKIIKNNKRIYFDNTNIKLLCLSFILTLITGFCTPLGLTPYTYMFKTMNGFSSSFILELSPTNIFWDSDFLFNTIIYIILIIFLKLKIKISDLFMLLGLYLMGILAVRNNAFLYLISSIILARLINNVYKNYKDKVDKVIENIQYILIKIFLFAVIIISIYLYEPNLHSKYIDEKTYSTKAADYIIENINIDDMRLYNSFVNGSYLEFRGIKVFVDSRSEVYCREFNNTTILEDWYYTSRLLVYYKDIFNKYNFTHILLSKDEPLNHYLKHDNDYLKIYEDKNFVLYQKNNQLK